MKVFFIMIFGVLFFCPTLQANDFMPVSVERDTILPKVFVIGDYERQFEALTLNHQTMLLNACEDNMEVAFDKWWSMIKEMEAYSSVIGFDLKGIKLWLNVFWEPNGSIRHIAFYLKPNSKNIDIAELTAFFSSFMNHYTFPLVAEVRFSHYGGASFPTFHKRIQSKKDSGDGTKNPTNKPLVKDSSRHKE